MRMVVQRELRAGSRRAITYWGRFLAAGVGIFLTVQGMGATGNGKDLFYVITTAGMALCILDGIRRAAATITEEKANGTLGLLLLTPLSGAELLFGKFVFAMVGALPL